MEGRAQGDSRNYGSDDRFQCAQKGGFHRSDFADACDESRKGQGRADDDDKSDGQPACQVQDGPECPDLTRYAQEQPADHHA